MTGIASHKGVSPGLAERGRPWMKAVLLLLLALAAPADMPGTAVAAGPERAVPIDPDPAVVARLFPSLSGPAGIARLEGNPPAWQVRDSNGVVGLIASTFEVSGSIGYSGQPIDVLVGITADAKIAGAELVRHNEPILTLGISAEDIARYVRQFAGYDLKSTRIEAFKEGGGLPPIIARATVSTGVIRDSILRTARTVALGRALIKESGAAIDRVSLKARTWSELAADGSLAHASIDLAEAARRFGPIAMPLPEEEALFADLWVALLDPPTVGSNLLGTLAYTKNVAALDAGDSALLVAASGLHSYRGTSYQTTGVFERIELIQGETTIRFRKSDYLRVDRLAPADSPSFREISLFRIASGSGFNPVKPFRIEVTAERERADGSVASIRIPVTYELPKSYMLAQAALVPGDDKPLWIAAWERKPVTIAIVAAMIVLVAIIFFAQESFVRRPRLWLWTRMSFLLFTLVFLGWNANGQLSVVQVVAFFHALLAGFQWETFLIEPVIFILWCFVALGLLFLGRGVYCGWLCPFGALQELLNEVAKRLGVRQIEVPFSLQERLWVIKYTLFVAILGLSFYSMEKALILSEVEPFKTAISMRFMRAWPFVLFVLLLLLAGLRIERFYCRYLCPLGAALGIPAKMKLFDWLHRRPQCGRECRFCETQCTVGAIDTLGRINPNECVLCLRCQVVMHDEHQCVVLKRRVAREATPGSVKTHDNANG